MKSILSSIRKIPRSLVFLAALVSVPSGFSFASVGPPTITTTGSGDWESTVPDAPWPGGTPPSFTDAVHVDVGHTLTVSQPEECFGLNVDGVVLLNASSQSIKIQIDGYETINNNGSIVIANDTHPITIAAEDGAVAFFYGNDIDYNGKKVFLNSITYHPDAVIGSGETVELSGPVQFYNLTVQAGGALIQGNNPLTINGNTSFASGTFTKSSGGFPVHFNADLSLDSKNQNLGDVVIGN